ncbi:DNA-3-methyladenine glycosylase I, partial [bacterium]|nr:DNA-3-methyladenine glycosylase I [bacterium]
VINKRKGFKNAFANFDVKKVAQFSEKETQALRQDASIIRNKLKISAAVNNARQFLKIQEEFGTYSAYIWDFVDGKPIVNQWKSLSAIPATSKISDMLSKDLKKRGFKFLGSTVMYAHMQATGIVNDHVVHCFRHQEVQQLYL